MNKTEDKLSVGFMKPLQAVAEGPLTMRTVSYTHLTLPTSDLV